MAKHQDRPSNGTPHRESRRRRRLHVRNFREICITAIAFSAVFVAMMVYLVHYVATNEQELINNSYNSRQEILLSENYRGRILSRDGDVLAESELDANQNETRVYPYSNLFAHVVGYSTQGRLGVEALANYYLINTNTSLSNQVANDVSGKKNPGDDVYTTLDVEIQQVADEQLNVYKGAVVVTEVKTGKILAMVSHPDFDPNEISEIWDSLVDDSDSSVLLNRATQGLYPPGSTFKIVTALEYIRENPTTWDDYSYTCTGAYYYDGGKIGCYHGAVHGTVSLETAFAKSCNCSFANIGMTLDRTSFRETLDDLLFDQELPLTLNYAQSSVSMAEDISEADMVQESFGQGTTLVTPMHLNMITCAIANDGALMRPYLIDHVQNDEGSIVKSFKASEYATLMTTEEAQTIQELMQYVVEEGTLSKLKGLSYTAAGKTGSAEYNNSTQDSHAWFTGYAPAEDPEIAVTVIVEGAGSANDYAVPIARRVFDAYFAQE